MDGRMRNILDIKRRTIYEYDINEILLLLMGFFSPMLILYIGGNSLFLYLLLISTAWCIANSLFGKRGRFYLLREHKWPLIFTLLALISTTICLVSDIEPWWKEGEGTQYIWSVMFLIFILFYSLYGNRKYVLYYIKGVYASAFFQMLWAVGQFVLFKVSGKSLNEVIIRDALHIISPLGYTAYRDGGISLSGLCWHPSNMAPLLTIGYVFSNNIILKVAFAVIAMISGSRTAILGIVVCVFFSICLRFRDIKAIFAVKRWLLLAVCIAICLGIIYFFFINTSIVERIIQLYGRYFSDKNALGNDGSAQAHFNYWLKTPEALKETPLINVLFGYGPGCSGYMGSRFLNMFVGTKWVLECDYMDCLWSNGILGFLARYIFYVAGAVRVVKRERRLLPLVMSFALMGITYNFICTWGLLFVYCIIIYWGMPEKPTDVPCDSVVVSNQCC